MVGKLIPSSALSGRDYDDPEGFYIRLRGIFKFSITFKMAFTSYTNYYASGMSQLTLKLLQQKKLTVLYRDLQYKWGFYSFVENFT